MGISVATDLGPAAIETLDVGDWVLSMNENTGELRFNEVKTTFRRSGSEIVEVVVEDEDGGSEWLETTAEHPFWVMGEAWTRAVELEAGDRLVDSDGDLLTVVGLRTGLEPKTVFNIEVAGDHTYFVGDLGVWVHNKALRYHEPPKPHELVGLEKKFGSKLVKVNSKTSVQGGGHLRKRWKNKDGKIFEWDYKKGAMEVYSKNGKRHLGEYNLKGIQTGKAKPGRRVEK